jgi:nucleoside 2-deoxyribosyltransferase
MKNKPSVYFAAPLFSQAELEFNRQVRDHLVPSFNVFLPQESGDLMFNLFRCGFSVKDAVQKVFAQDVAAIRRCDVFIILLDGRTIDEGAAFELGLAFALRKVCVGLQTDVRRLASFGNNPMIDGALEIVFSRVDEMAAWLEGRFPLADKSREC